MWRGQRSCKDSSRRPPIHDQRSFADRDNSTVGEIKSESSALCVSVDLALRIEESQTNMSAARAWTLMFLAAFVTFAPWVDHDSKGG